MMTRHSCSLGCANIRRDGHVKALISLPPHGKGDAPQLRRANVSDNGRLRGAREICGGACRVFIRNSARNPHTPKRCREIGASQLSAGGAPAQCIVNGESFEWKAFGERDSSCHPSMVGSPTAAVPLALGM